MKKVWIFILIAVIALGVTAVASANDVCPRDTDGWSSEQTGSLVDKSGEGAVEYCVKGGNVSVTGAGCNAYLEFGSFEEVSVVVDAEGACGLSHWTYRVEEEEPEYRLEAWAQADCTEACLYIAVYDGDEMIMGPFKTFCTQWSNPSELETAGPWTNITYNAGGDIGTLSAPDVGEIGEPEECLPEYCTLIGVPPETPVDSDVCEPCEWNQELWSGSEECVEPTPEPEECVDGEIESAVFSFNGAGGWAGWSCPAGEIIINGRVIPSSFPTNFSGPAKEGEPMYPVYPHYTYTPPEEGWVVQDGGEAGRAQICMVCAVPTPETPTPTPPPKKPPPSGGADEAGFAVVAFMAAGGLLALGVGIREFMKAKKEG